MTRRAHLPPERQIELLEDDLRRKEMELLECHAALRSIKAIAIERVGK